MPGNEELQIGLTLHADTTQRRRRSSEVAWPCLQVELKEELQTGLKYCQMA
jgi:hypothetical protein